MSKNIIVVAGPCAAESEEQIMEMGYKTGATGNVVRPYGIDTKLRAGCWKPRTSYWEKTNGHKKKVFEGVGEIGLAWLAKAADKYNLSIVSELMSEMDLRHFNRHLKRDRDYIQIGARTNQAFALLYAVGGDNYGVVLKNPQHGVDVKEAVGSLDRFEKSREKIYFIRGQIKYIHPNGFPTDGHKSYMDELLKDPLQHPESRNLNNIGSINLLRNDKSFIETGALIGYDASHTWGGKTHLMRRKIGEFTIKAVREFGYDWVMVETLDRSRYAKCDKDQASFTTLNGIDWTQTAAMKEPPKEELPTTLVDIVKDIMAFQIQTGHVDFSEERLNQDYKRLDEIRWDMVPPKD